MFEKIRLIISKELDVEEDKITMDTNLQEDLGADSLDAVELIMAIEEQFAITIPDDVAQKIRTVGDIINFLETL